MSTWTKDKPTTPGKWRVSIVPEKRTSYAFKYVFEGPVSHCNVVLRKTDPDTVQLRVSIDNAEDYRLYSLTDPWFDGALWMCDEHPADPFAETQPSYSQDSDLP